MRTETSDTFTARRGRGGGRPAKYPWDEILALDGFATDEDGNVLHDSEGNPIEEWKRLDLGTDIPDATVPSFISSARQAVAKRNEQRAENESDTRLVLSTQTVLPDDADLSAETKPEPVAARLRVVEGPWPEPTEDESSADESSEDGDTE